MQKELNWVGLATISASGGMEPTELSNIVAMDANCYYHLEQLFGNCYLINLTHTYPII